MEDREIRDMLISLSKDVQHVGEQVVLLVKGVDRTNERVENLMLHQQIQDAEISTLKAENTRSQVYLQKLEDIILGAGGLLDRVRTLEKSGSDVAKEALIKAVEALDLIKKYRYQIAGAAGAGAAVVSIIQFLIGNASTIFK